MSARRSCPSQVVLEPSAQRFLSRAFALRAEMIRKAAPRRACTITNRRPAIRSQALLALVSAANPVRSVLSDRGRQAGCRQAEPAFSQALVALCLVAVELHMGIDPRPIQFRESAIVGLGCHGSTDRGPQHLFDVLGAGRQHPMTGAGRGVGSSNRRTATARRPCGPQSSVGQTSLRNGKQIRCSIRVRKVARRTTEWTAHMRVGYAADARNVVKGRTATSRGQRWECCDAVGSC
jgi:hypothetical protein